MATQIDNAVMPEAESPPSLTWLSHPRLLPAETTDWKPFEWDFMQHSKSMLGASYCLSRFDTVRWNKFRVPWKRLFSLLSFFLRSLSRSLALRPCGGFPSRTACFLMGQKWKELLNLLWIDVDTYSKWFDTEKCSSYRGCYFDLRPLYLSLFLSFLVSHDLWFRQS